MLSVKANTSKPGTPDYDIPATFELRDHAQVREAWLLGDGDPMQADVAFKPASGASRAAMALGEPVDGQPWMRRFSVRRTDVFARWLLSFAGDAMPTGPEELVSEFGALARVTRGLYDGADGTSTAASGAFAE
jgi:hypothetical protein